MKFDLCQTILSTNGVAYRNRFPYGNIHYGHLSHFWWEFSNPQTQFPIGIELETQAAKDSKV
ncbi:7144_t:CDS:2 [Diversispora eburnea]|uniref:7144_t:CDS:1 n=1 Tax=Diversispora eburnea TaxID=1213867 RepID=A0A9N8YK05_9GLOM|nr:7144_t:CDS:2 [Diversispora eburnea]